MSYMLFLDGITENQRSIISFLDDQFLGFPNVDRKIRFRIPFYDYQSWVCYLRPKKNDTVELCFIWGKLLSNHHGLLQDRGRKQVSGIYLDNLETIPLESILESFAEAIVLDEEIKKK